MVKIRPTNGSTVEVSGSRWTVTDTGDLHVYESSTNEGSALQHPDKKPVASFARGTWLHVQVTPGKSGADA